MVKLYKVTENKYLEIQTTKDKNIMFSFSFLWSTKQDHSGLSFKFSIFNKEFFIQIYDQRHWDLHNDTWKTYATTVEEIALETLELDLEDKKEIWELINQVVRKPIKETHNVQYN